LSVEFSGKCKTLITCAILSLKLKLQAE